MIKTILSILLLCAFTCESYATELFSTRVQSALRGALNDSGKWTTIDFADGTSQTTASTGGGGGGGAVNSVFGRTGTVTASTNDYTWAQINKATSNIADITTKSHTSLTDIGTNTHAQIDTFISSKAQASGLASLSAGSKVVQDPANATATPTANKIPIADASGLLDAWITPGGGINNITSIPNRSHTDLQDIGSNNHVQIDTFISSKASASGIASLDASSLVVQNPANATSTPTAGKIPIADGSGKLDGWVTGGPGTSTPTANKLSIADSNGKLDSWITAGSTLAGASSIQKVAHKWTVGASHTGNTNETSVYSWAMPGSTVVGGDILRITSYVSFTNNANAKNYRVKFGGTTYTNIGYTSVGAAKYQTDIIVRGTTSQLTCQSTGNSNGGWSTSSNGNSSTENTAGSITIDFTWQLANGSDTATLEAVTIEVL